VPPSPLLHLPLSSISLSTFVDPTFGHLTQLLVSPLSMAQVPPCYQHTGDHPSHLFADREILAFSSGLRWTVTLRVEATEICHDALVPLSSPYKRHLQSPLKGSSMGEGKSLYTVLGN